MAYQRYSAQPPRHRDRKERKKDTGTEKWSTETKKSLLAAGAFLGVAAFGGIMNAMDPQAQGQSAGAPDGTPPALVAPLPTPTSADSAYRATPLASTLSQLPAMAPTSVAHTQTAQSAEHTAKTKAPHGKQQATKAPGAASSGAADTAGAAGAQPTTPHTPNTCGGPANDDGYTFCNGSLVRHPAADVCDYFNCIENFWYGSGYMVECNDGRYSMTGGKNEACWDNGGVDRPVYSS